MSLHCDLDLEDSNQSSCMTLWPMVLHQHTKFGYKQFSSWEDIVQMNTHWNSEPFLQTRPWPQQSNPIFSQDNQVYDDAPSNQVKMQKNQQLRRYIRKSYFDCNDPSLWPWPWRHQTNLLKYTLAHDDIPPYQVYHYMNSHFSCESKTAEVF